MFPREPKRRLMHVAVAVYVLSYVLPSYRIQLFSESRYQFGWEAALWVEVMVWGLAGDLVNSGISGVPRQFAMANVDDLKGCLMILSGAAANHLFLFAYVTALFRWLRTAIVSAWLAAVAAVGCLLPGQLFDSNWSLGPGYFVWCAAPVLFAFACGKPFSSSALVPQAPFGNANSQSSAPGSETSSVILETGQNNSP